MFLECIEYLLIIIDNTNHSDNQHTSCEGKLVSYNFDTGRYNEAISSKSHQLNDREFEKYVKRQR